MDLKKNKTFCMAPWVHTYLGPNNARNLCCAGDADFGDKNSLEDTWNSATMKRIRVDLLDNKEIKECERCPLSAEHTYRRYWNDKFKYLIDDVIKKTSEDGTYYGNPISVDYRTNVCNFKCKTCNPTYSSAIFNEYIKLQLLTDDEIKTLKSQFENNKSLIKKELDFLINTGDVVDMYWAGGEPLYFKEHWESLKKLIDFGQSKNVTLRYSSNLSSISWKGEYLIDYLDKFKHTEIMCSMDATGDLGGWIRNGFEYETFLKNFETLVDFRNKNPEKLQIILYSVLTLPTLVDLPNINKMANKYKVDLYVQEIIGSHKLLGIRNYPKNIILEILDSIKLEIITEGGKNVPFLVKLIDELKLCKISDNITPDDIREFLFIEKNRKDNLTIENIINYNENLKNFYLSKKKNITDDSIINFNKDHMNRKMKNSKII